MPRWIIKILRVPFGNKEHITDDTWINISPKFCSEQAVTLNIFVLIHSLGIFFLKFGLVGTCT